MKYFENIPLVSYDGNPAVNITASPNISNQTRNQKEVFYRYSMSEHMRADTLSHLYYDSVNYTWLIYIANDIIDPYYDYHLSDSSFEKYMSDKYGSFEASLSKISYWRTNWRNDTSEISVDAYETLSESKKKYYSPRLNTELNTHSYIRKAKDLYCSSNVTGVIEFDGPVNLEAEEIIVTQNCKFSVINSFTNFVNFNNLFGSINPGQIIKNFKVVSVIILSRSIPEDEIQFWEPITFYQDEYEKNEEKMNMVLIDDTYKTTIEREIKRVMSSE